MPRKSRIDVPGALHPMIALGIDRQKIFYDDAEQKYALQAEGYDFGRFQYHT